VTPEEMNMAIAEECGWQWYRMPFKFGDTRKYRCLFLPAVHEYEGQSKEWLVRADMTETVCNWEYMRKEGLVHDYVNDLKAMHEAILCLDKIIHEKDVCLRDVFASEMEELFSQSGTNHPQLWCMFDLLNATARQRAEAFLRTIGKWRVA
jgi:hypothetical protein